MFRTFERHLSGNDWNGELVFAFGSATVDEAISDRFVFRIPNCRLVDPGRLCSSIEMERWRNGVVFVADEECGRREGWALQAVQMRILNAYYGFHFDSATPYEPSAELQMLHSWLSDPSRSISQLKNMPWLLRYPLADKLADRSAGLPVLIVMAGNSAQAVRPRLGEMARGCLVVCIARSLALCLEEGVEPDFVVQYDTNYEQQHFYETVPPLKNTVLVSLSSAHIEHYAWKFRGVFFRASFNKLIIPNEYKLRDGSEGSLLACMGLAEALAAPEVYLAGCDFSWKEDEDQYAGVAAEAQGLASRDGDHRILPWESSPGVAVPGRFTLAGRQGETVHSTMGYIAAASKAASYAEEMGRDTGCRFHLCTDEGILHPELFPVAQRQAQEALPGLDREAFLRLVDEALAEGPGADLTAARLFFAKLGGFVAQQQLHFAIIEKSPGYRFEQEESFLKLLANVRCLVPRMDRDRAQAARLVGAWTRAYRYAAKITRAYKEAARGPLPVLCEAQERERLVAAIDGYFPRRLVKLRVLSGFTEAPGSEDAGALSPRLFKKWLAGQGMVFVSALLARRYDYLFEMLPDDNIVVLPDFDAV